MNFSNRAVLFLATGGYIGNLPVAPGTFGSILGLAPAYLIAGLKLPLAVLCTGLFIGFAAWIAHLAEKVSQKKDPGCIVIDEISGMIVTLIGMPFTVTTAVVGFILFRLLDILKPFPIRLLDKRLPGGAGVVADDVVAGIFANLLLRIFIDFLYFE